jgi:hypothetical protein
LDWDKGHQLLVDINPSNKRRKMNDIGQSQETIRSVEVARQAFAFMDYARKKKSPPERSEHPTC